MSAPAVFRVEDLDFAKGGGLVTVHAATSFFYNTAVLALGINILASLLSG